MPKKPKVSVVLPTYQNAAFLPSTIDSLRKQSLENIEIIVVDDCSTDSTDQILDFYKREDKRIRVFKMERRLGGAGCRNFGNNKARASIIMVSDSGDISHRDRAKIGYEFLRDNRDIDIYGTACVEVSATGEQVMAHFPEPWQDNEKPVLFHPTILYRKRVPNIIKYREGNIYTDQYEAFFIEALRAGYGFAFDQDIMVQKLIQKKDPKAYRERMIQRLKNYIELGIKVPKEFNDYMKYIPKKESKNAKIQVD